MFRIIRTELSVWEPRTESKFGGGLISREAAIGGDDVYQCLPTVAQKLNKFQICSLMRPDKYYSRVARHLRPMLFIDDLTEWLWGSVPAFQSELKVLTISDDHCSRGTGCGIVRMIFWALTRPKVLDFQCLWFP